MRKTRRPSPYIRFVILNQVRWIKTESAFIDKNAAHDDQQHLLLAADRHHPQHAADGQRTGVAHEDPGRVAIEPEEAKGGADQSHADDTKFASERIKRESEDRCAIFTLPGDVSEHAHK